MVFFFIPCQSNKRESAFRIPPDVPGRFLEISKAIHSNPQYKCLGIYRRDTAKGRLNPWP